ncbi:MAG: hypothetical protein RLZZ455_130 [Candidatus Parcubacteria bacterium]|jgi:hypothetical protein
MIEKSSSEKKKAVEHIVYEIMMFNAASLQLMPPPSNQLQTNILLESFAIHSRNLFDFFYTKPKKDDISAGDYLSRKKEFILKRTKKKVLKNLTRKTNKQIAHLTYSRNNYNSHTKGWGVISINKFMNQTIIAFLECLERDQKDWFRELYRRYNIKV